jgi:hypothetical protein
MIASPALPQSLARCEACGKQYRVRHADRTHVCQSCGGTVVATDEAEATSPADEPSASTLAKEAAQSLRAAYKWINGVTWLYRLGALAYAIATLAAIVALTQPVVPVGPGMLVVGLTTSLSVIMVLGALLILFQPFAWTLAIAVLATCVSVVHGIGPDPLGVAGMASSALALLAWAALYPTWRFRQLIRQHQDLYILHHASSNTKRALRRRTPEERHSRLVSVMHRAARRAWKLSAVATVGIMVASALGTALALTQVRPQEFGEAHAKFELAWNSGDLDTVNQLIVDENRETQGRLLAGLATSYGWTDQLPPLGDPDIERDKTRALVHYWVGNKTLTALWLRQGRDWALSAIEFPKPPFEPAFENFLTAWSETGVDGIITFYSPENRTKIRESIDAAIERRSWDPLPRILDTEKKDMGDNRIHVTLYLAEGNVLTKWHLRPDSTWGLHGIGFP